ncbi:MAG: 50S ribosomal protein L24 [Candidatus Babeliales bacterium]
MERVKKTDTVTVVSGKDKGKSGKVIEILPKKGKVLVKGVALVTKHQKARKQGEVSAIKKQESFVDLSNVMPNCTSCKKPVRIGAKVIDSGKRIRVCKSCNENF